MGTHHGGAYDGYLGSCAISLLHPEANVSVGTNDDGGFSMMGPADVVATAILVLTPDLDGCGDPNTGVTLAIKMMSPPGSTALSPMSTLIVAVMIEGNMTEEEADDKVSFARLWTGCLLHREAHESAGYPI